MKKFITTLIATTTLITALAISASAEPLPGTTYNLDEHGYLVKENSPPLPGTTYKTDENGYLVRQVDLPPWPNQHWLILIPPITSGYEVLTNAPFADWQQADSYPTAQACAKAIAGTSAGNFAGNYLLQVIMHQGGAIGLDQLAGIKQQTMHATCIASDDPRLFQNTKQAGK
jgi:hypothetical protein